MRRRLHFPNLQSAERLDQIVVGIESVAQAKTRNDTAKAIERASSPSLPLNGILMDRAASTAATHLGRGIREWLQTRIH
jgi:hypothetical protein